MLNATLVMERAATYEKEMVNFLRDMIKIPSERVILRIKEEMEKVGFDEVKIDKMGNVLGRIGNGSKIIAMDAHIDTVGVGDKDSWKWDPFEGKVEDGVIFGRGASDQEASMASMVYAGKVIKDLGLHGDYTLWVTGTVQEEDCDGLCWQYILKENILKPEVVVITEPTNLGIYRGHRGRMEMSVTTNGVSCHGSAPERGENAVYSIAKVVNEIEKLDGRLKDDSFLGKGTVTVSYIECDTPSLCAVPDRGYIHLDRRLTDGETMESAVVEVEDAVKRGGVKASVDVLDYDTPSYNGFVYPTKKYYPTWVLEEDHPLCKAAIKNYKILFGEEPRVDKWTFSTNGIATMGMMGVPTIGFGPANEIYAHSTDDQCPIEHLIKACAWYAAFPTTWCEK